MHVYDEHEASSPLFCLCIPANEQISLIFMMMIASCVTMVYVSEIPILELDFLHSLGKRLVVVTPKW